MGGKGRSSGEGHVRWDERLKVYEARLYVPVKPRPLYGGKRVLPFYSKGSVALEKQATAKREMDEGRGRSRGLTFGAYLVRWLDALESLKSVSEATLSDYLHHALKHLIPPDRLGNVPLADLTAGDLDSLYARLVAEMGRATRHNHVHAAARAALSRAFKKRLMPFNPARDADPPRYSTGEREYRTLSEEEVERFFEAAKGDRFEAFFVAAILAGPRPAELRALSREDVTLPDSSLEEGMALIRRTVSQVCKGSPFIRNTTKTRKPRSVPLLPEVDVAFKAHRARQNEERLKLGDLWRDQGLLFPFSPGGPLSVPGRT